MKTGWQRAGLGLVACLTLASCKPDETWRQKLTLVVATPAGERTGSAVVEVHGDMRRLLPMGNDVNYTLRGEGAFVEVAPGRYLFALIRNDEERYHIAGRGLFIGMTPEEWLPKIPEQVGAISLIPDSVPDLVTFADVGEPKSVMPVDPADLAATFGPGFSLKSATLEITAEPMTAGQVQRVLTWLPDIWPNLLDGRNVKTIDAEYPFANSVGAGSFSTEVTK